MFGRSFDTRASTYRFEVGTKVICRTGTDEWSAGTIIATSYREPYWPPGKIAPYQVELTNGTLIFVPADIDQLCRKLVPPWWAGAFRGSPDSLKQSNPSADSIVEKCGQNDVNAKSHEGSTALMEAVKKTWPNAIKQLISMKADVDMADGNKTRAIHIAAPHGLDIIKPLVDAKADLNCQDQDPDYDPEFTSTTFGDRLEHRTALHYVCLTGDAPSAKLLLKANADVDIPDAQFKTPLHLAIDEDQGDCIDVLLSAGANMNLGNHSCGMENSALMDAASKGKTEIVKKLVAAKADINRKGKQQMSALHMAARSNRIEVCEALLAAKADMNQESNFGTPSQLAQKNGGADLLKIFDVQSDAPESGCNNISSLDAAQRAALFLD